MSEGETKPPGVSTPTVVVEAHNIGKERSVYGEHLKADTCCSHI